MGESQAMKFWRGVVRENGYRRVLRNLPKSDYLHRARFNGDTCAAWFKDGSAVQWSRRNGEMVDFEPAKARTGGERGEG